MKKRGSPPPKRYPQPRGTHKGFWTCRLNDEPHKTQLVGGFGFHIEPAEEGWYGLNWANRKPR